MILPTSAFGQVAQGDLAIMQPEAPIGGRYQAKVSVVDRVLDASSGTFGVRLELPNANRTLPAGARCRSCNTFTRPQPAAAAGIAAVPGEDHARVALRCTTDARQMHDLHREP